MSVLADFTFHLKLIPLGLLSKKKGIVCIHSNAQALLAYGQNKQLMERQISVLPGRHLAAPQRRTDFVQKKLFFDVNLATRFQFFDPDDPARYQLYANIEAGLVCQIMGLKVGLWGRYHQ